MRLIANCQLTGDYGTVAKGQDFVVSDEDAKQLIAEHKARRADPPSILYETKPARFETPMIVPQAPGVSARDTFRDGALHHPESPGVAPESDSMLPKSNASESGTADPGRRGRREGSGSSG